MWQPGMAIVDFTNPEACRWFAGKLEELIDMELTVLRQTLARGYLILVLLILMALIRRACIISIHIFIIRQYMIFLYARKAKKEAILLHALQLLADRSFLVHWAVTAGLIMESMEESLFGLSYTFGIRILGQGYWWI